MSENEMLEEIKSLSPSEEAILTMLIRYQNLKAELEKEKEKEKVEGFEYALSNGEVTTINKFDNNVPTKLIGSYTHGKEVVNFIKRNFVSKNKLKEIIYPTPENYISIEVQQSEMYKKLVKEVEE